jgi:hypothetical protein
MVERRRRLSSNFWLNRFDAQCRRNFPQQVNR